MHDHPRSCELRLRLGGRGFLLRFTEDRRVGVAVSSVLVGEKSLKRWAFSGAWQNSAITQRSHSGLRALQT